MNKSDKITQELLKPPYGGQAAFATFLAKLQKRRMDRVDGPFLRELEIASPGNESKVINGLKFLGLIREDGTATEKMRALYVEGEQFQKALESVVREAYSVLFKNINVGNAQTVDVRNCFKVDYGMAPQLAVEATRIFTYLAKAAGIQLSPEIMSEESSTSKGISIKGSTKSSNKSPAKPKSKGTPKTAVDERQSRDGENMFVPKGMQRFEIQNKVILCLPEVADKAIRAQASKFARQLIEMYESTEYSQA
jgi:hypothetical protein